VANGTEKKTAMPPKKQKQQSAGGAKSNDMDVIDEFMKGAAGAATGSKAISKKAEKVLRGIMEDFQVDQYIQEMQMRQQVQSMQAEEIAARRVVRDGNHTQNPDRFVEIERHYVEWTLLPGETSKWVRYAQFTPDMMEAVMKMIAAHLPEPYSTPTYEHFIMGFPDLCILLYGAEAASKPAAETKGDFIGAIVSSLKMKDPLMGPFRGYVAMLAVEPAWRGHRLGQQLVKLTCELMKRKRADEVCLETPVDNDKALALYTKLGFSKTKYLTRYYMDGRDAVRLKVWFEAPENLMEKQLMQQQAAMQSMQQAGRR
jgi:peptide alpha-N-acetyltransferase